jgi:uncharacterized protein (TIGR02145 family)
LAPKGWHLPSIQEYHELIAFFADPNAADKKTVGIKKIQKLKPSIKDLIYSLLGGCGNPAGTIF